MRETGASALLAATCCGLVGGVNHLTRDFLAALELQIEYQLGLSASQYHLLNAGFFLPNLVLPLFCGFAAQLLGPSVTQVLAALVACVGNALFLSAVASICDAPYSRMLAGRLLAGIVYEGLDFFWIPIVQPLVPPSRFATVSSFINAGQRAGSAVAFLLTPLLYSTAGLRVAMVVPSAVGIAIVLPAAMALGLARRPGGRSSGDESNGDGDGGSSVQGCPQRQRRCRSSLSPRGFGARYWLLLLCAALMYAAVVPFWFVGSKLLQQTHGLSVEHADALSECQLTPARAETRTGFPSLPKPLCLPRRSLAAALRVFTRRSSHTLAVLIPELAVLLIGPLAAILADRAGEAPSTAFHNLPLPSHTCHSGRPRSARNERAAGRDHERPAAHRARLRAPAAWHGRRGRFLECRPLLWPAGPQRVDGLRRVWLAASGAAAAARRGVGCVARAALGPLPHVLPAEPPGSRRWLLGRRYQHRPCAGAARAQVRRAPVPFLRLLTSFSTLGFPPRQSRSRRRRTPLNACDARFGAGRRSGLCAPAGARSSNLRGPRRVVGGRCRA